MITNWLSFLRLFYRHSRSEDSPKSIFLKRLQKDWPHGKSSIKKGFSIPIINWLRSEIREYVNDILSECKIKKLNYFNPIFISKIKESHLGSKSNFDEKLWALISFVKWHQKYVDHA